MARPPKDDDTTQKLKPGDKAQRAKYRTKIGPLSKEAVTAAFRKLTRPRSRDWYAHGKDYR